MSQKEVIVSPGGIGYLERGPDDVYLPTGWAERNDINGHLVRYRKTKQHADVWASYTPKIETSTCYICEVFIPNFHATTRAAKYSVTHHENGVRHQTDVFVNQFNAKDEWIPLGTFHIKSDDPESGLIILSDETTDHGREIGFSAIRYRPVFGVQAPVGTIKERESGAIWPGHWTDSNPFLKMYFLGYHNGADLNLNFPEWDMDPHLPCYSIADGEVIFAGKTNSKSWRELLVISHGEMADGNPLYSRYGHVENILVSAGDHVQLGQQVAHIGESGGTGGNFHLHFDLCKTDVLVDNPEHWPGTNRNAVVTNYLDPKKFLEQNLVCKHGAD